jgi:thioredoxin reductase (NADPH)
MTKATILAVDDDAAVSRAIVRDLRARYGADYRILRATSGDEALSLLKELTLKDRPLALVVSDQRMPGMTGIELLGHVREQSPDTKLLLLTAYADTDVAITAINQIGLDYYLFKPWDPPEERLYPVADDLLGDWVELHPDQDSEIRVVGHLWSDESYDVKMFLTRNHVPYRWLDVEREPEARQLVDLAAAAPEELPLVLMPDGQQLRAPGTVALAEALGLRTSAQQPLYDLCIVGGGPAGPARARRSRTTSASPRVSREPT